MEDKLIKELSYQELKDLATEKGIEFKGNISKADLLALLTEVEPPIKEDLVEEEENFEPQEELEIETPAEEKEVETLEEDTKLTEVEEKEVIEQPLITISIDNEDILLLLDALKEYARYLNNNKRNTNKLVINEAFNNKIASKIKRTDKLRFLIKKKALIVDKDLKLYSDRENGEVVGLETFESTEEGRVIKLAKPATIGSTPNPNKNNKEKKVKASVSSVSEI